MVLGGLLTCGEEAGKLDREGGRAYGIGRSPGFTRANPREIRQMQAYSDQTRESDPHALPDIEVFQLTAEEAAFQDEDLVYEYSKRPEFRLCFMNSRTREAMTAKIIEEQGITGGWFWWSCSPGCLPDGPAFGPFASEADAMADAREQYDPEA